MSNLRTESLTEVGKEMSLIFKPVEEVRGVFKRIIDSFKFLH